MTAYLVSYVSYVVLIQEQCLFCYIVDSKYLIIYPLLSEGLSWIIYNTGGGTFARLLMVLFTSKKK